MKGEKYTHVNPVRNVLGGSNRSGCRGRMAPLPSCVSLRQENGTDQRESRRWAAGALPLTPHPRAGKALAGPGRTPQHTLARLLHPTLPSHTASPSTSDGQPLMLVLGSSQFMTVIPNFNETAQNHVIIYFLLVYFINFFHLAVLASPGGGGASAQH